MFDLSKFPKDARKTFRGESVLWPSAVMEAIEGGVSNVDDLTDLAFFMQHKERMDGNKGRPLRQGERDFKALGAQWSGLRSMITDMVESAGTGGKEEDDWDVPDPVLRDIREMGGKAAENWAKKPPSRRREAREFRPASAHRDDYAALILWKSRKPAQTCIIDKHRVQGAFLLRDDIAYWRQRTDSETEAQVKQAAARGRLLDLRKFVVEDKLCIAGALHKSKELGDSLILQMAGTLLAMIPVPGIKGDEIVQSLGELISAVSAKLNE